MEIKQLTLDEVVAHNSDGDLVCTLISVRYGLLPLTVGTWAPGCWFLTF